MPLTVPTLDTRTYQDLLAEARARIPVYTPEWTNFNESDPGMTLVEVFAFLTESLLYRANQIPERNRRKFLALLGIPLQPATSARGLITFANERGPRQTLTLNDGLEVRAGAVPFRTAAGLDVLPIAAQVFYKRRLANQDPALVAYYRQLYASYMQGRAASAPADPLLYETVPFSPRANEPIDLGSQTVDHALWIALLARPGDVGQLAQVREALVGKTLSLGVVPAHDAGGQRLGPGGTANTEATPLLQYLLPASDILPAAPANGVPADRVPHYVPLPASATTNVLNEPGVVQITLPGDRAQLEFWSNLDPLEAGVGDFPPALDDTNLNDRLITWLRVQAAPGTQAPLLWVGINAVFVAQRAHVANELLPPGTGEPDQTATLARTPVLPGSVHLTVAGAAGPEPWAEIEDLFCAGPEVPVPDPRQPPGAPVANNPQVKVFTVNAESGEIHFGDGARGARPPPGAVLRASYDYGVGAQGNVGPGAINAGAALPAGLKVSNPVRTWGGSVAETVRQGERQIARTLQHRDRLVTADDFATITWRTPGVDIGRLDVLPAFHPELSPNEPGDAPGAVTLLVIPRTDAAHPTAPVPDQQFLDTICAYLDPRRLVTTEVFLRGPIYQPLWVSVGVNVVAGASIATVREAVRAALLQFLAPLPTQSGPAPGPCDDPSMQPQGWPLRKPVVARELLAVASRVPGVLLVNDVILATGSADRVDQVPLRGLQLPQVAGISVVPGDPLPLAQLRGQGAPSVDLGRFVPVPVVVEECR